MSKFPKIVEDISLPDLVEGRLVFPLGHAIGDACTWVYYRAWAAREVADHMDRELAGVVLLYEGEDHISEIRWDVLRNFLRSDIRFDLLGTITQKELRDVLRPEYQEFELWGEWRHCGLPFLCMMLNARDALYSPEHHRVPEERHGLVLGSSFREGYEEVCRWSEGETVVGVYPFRGITEPILSAGEHGLLVDGLICRGYRVVLFGDLAFEDAVRSSQNGRYIDLYREEWEEVLPEMEDFGERFLGMYHCSDTHRLLGAAQACNVLVCEPTRCHAWFHAVHRYVVALGDPPALHGDCNLVITPRRGTRDEMLQRVLSRVDAGRDTVVEYGKGVEVREVRDTN